MCRQGTKAVFFITKALSAATSVCFCKGFVENLRECIFTCLYFKIHDV